MGNVFIFLGLLIFAAHLFSAIFSRRKIPDVLWLLIIGLIIGPLFKIISPSDLGKVGPIFSSITLIVILFESGMDISIKTLLSSWKATMTICISCFIMSSTLITVLGVFVFYMPLLSALTLGAAMGGTSSAVVVPLIQHLKVGKQTRNILILESAITDVLCIVFALAFMQSFKSGDLNIPRIFGNILASFTMASIIGISGGIVWATILERIRKIQNSMFLTPAFVFVLYGLSESMNFSGAIAALTFGITIANTEYFQFSFLKPFQKQGMIKLAPVERSFISEIVFLLKTFFFVYIGISIPFDDINCMAFGGIITLALFAGRLILTKFTPCKVNSYDKAIISMMIPKGLAAAVLASLPEQIGMPYGKEIKLITYAVIFTSILLTSVMILLTERYPKLTFAYRRFFKTKEKTPALSGLTHEESLSFSKSEENEEEDNNNTVGNS